MMDTLELGFFFGVHYTVHPVYLPCVESLPLFSLNSGLATTKLATFLEDRINGYLHKANAHRDGAGRITIRVVSSSDKTLETRMLMKERFASDFPAQFPYRTKAMFVFEEIDGVDVCFFGMHVQEYGSDCQAPNTRCVWVCVCGCVCVCVCV